MGGVITSVSVFPLNEPYLTQYTMKIRERLYDEGHDTDTSHDDATILFSVSHKDYTLKLFHGHEPFFDYHTEPPTRMSVWSRKKQRHIDTRFLTKVITFRDDVQLLEYSCTVYDINSTVTAFTTLMSAIDDGHEPTKNVCVRRVHYYDES